MEYKNYSLEGITAGTYVVHHAQDYNDMGGSQMRVLEIVGSFESLDEAIEFGDKMYPNPSTWAYDHFVVNINTATDLGKQEYDNFCKRFDAMAKEQEEHPEDYRRFQFGEYYFSVQKSPFLDCEGDSQKNNPR